MVGEWSTNSAQKGKAKNQIMLLAVMKQEAILKTCSPFEDENKTKCNFKEKDGSRWSNPQHSENVRCALELS